MAKDASYHDGFNNGVILALAVINGAGDCGDASYEELLSSAGKDRIIAYARKTSSMRFAGLDKYLRMTREMA